MKFVLFLDCSKETMIERIMKRAEEAGDEKRSDDNMDVLLKRFETFNE
jgi:adenylate kinase family enzyme